MPASNLVAPGQGTIEDSYRSASSTWGSAPSPGRIYTDDALERAFGPFGVCGISLRSPGVRDRLLPQDGLYAVAERGGEAERLQVIGCLREILVGPEAPAAGGPADRRSRDRRGEPDRDREGLWPRSRVRSPAHTGPPDIRYDLERPERPRSAIGALVAGLDARRRARAPPPTVLSCDNLPDNGATLRGLALAFAALRDEALAGWIDSEVAFPCTMVDRIVPATAQADIEGISARLGVADAAPVICEPFRQWVIEDRFTGARPAWERVGAELVADVAPYEEMKLRLLNGSHSALAYLGWLAGFEHVFEVMREGAFVAFLRRMMAEEVAPTLSVPADVASYQEALLERFANPALAHRTAQIAMDGSQKLPQRLLGTVRDQLRAGGPIRLLCLAIAGWMRYATGNDEAGRPIAVADPLAPRFSHIATRAGRDPAALAHGFLSLREVFGDDLPADERFVAEITGLLASLLDRGARATVTEAAGR